MTEDEAESLVLEWMIAKGGEVTQYHFEALIAILEEHFDSPKTATLQDARQVLGLAN